MRFLIATVVLVVFVWVNLSESATWRGQGSDPKYPGKCLYDEKEVLDYGQEYHPIDHCTKITCYEGGDLVGVTCGVKTVENCNDTGYVDVSKPYPECCLKKFVCREGGEEKIYEL